MRRVVLDQSGRARASMPGYDAVDAALDQVAWDAKLSNIAHAIRGEVMLPHKTTTGFPAVLTTIPFGRMFASPPIVIGSLVASVTVGAVTNPNYMALVYLNGVTFTWSSSDPMLPSVAGINFQIFRDRMQMTSFVNTNFVGPAQRVRYMVIG